jgi:DNA-binding CsgD family transcriptional regulator
VAAAACGRQLALALVRLGMLVMLLASLADLAAVVADRAGAGALIEGLGSTTISVLGLRQPWAVASLLQSPGRAQLPALAFAGVGAVDIGAQSHYSEVALAIVWVIAVVVVAPRWVALCAATSIVGYAADMILAGHSLRWVLSGGGSRAFVNQGIGLAANGAIAVILITLLRRHLESAPASLEAVRAGGPSLTPTLALAARDAPLALPRADPRDLTSSLTLAERDVLAHLAGGRTAKQVAFDHGLALATVRTHIASAKRKVGARTLEQLVALYAQAEHDR